jgi:opacity protein-like surface antigen
MVNTRFYPFLCFFMAGQLGIAAAAYPLTPKPENGLNLNASAPTVTEVTGGTSSPFEISPTVGFMGASALIGARASMNYFPVSLELAAEQVLGRTATLYPITFNAILDMANSTRTIPYGLVGGGLFLTVPLNSVGDQTVSSVGLCFGGGFKYFINSKIGIRFETKQLFTRIKNQHDDHQELLIFQSSSLGVVFAFG